MSLIYKIIIAYMLDLILGDPYRIPHPITYIGKLIKKIEKIKNLLNPKSEIPNWLLG